MLLPPLAFEENSRSLSWLPVDPGTPHLGYASCIASPASPLRWYPRMPQSGGRKPASLPRRVKLLHLSNAFYPQVTAGTEIFIHQLIEAQQAISLSPTVRWAAHRPQSPEGSSAAMALTPHQVLLPPVPSSNRHEDVSSTASAIPGFADLLDSFEPEHLHLHSLSPACGLAHVRAANARSIPVLVTVHAPGFTCMQGSLLYHRRSLCDGVIRDRRCTECRLVNGGLPAPLAELVALQSGWPLSAEQDGRVPHVLTSRQLTRAFRLGWEQG